jgi:hypothetical protein
MTFARGLLNDLLNLATVGDIGALRKKLRTILNSDLSYRPFVEQMRELAQGFRIDRIVALLKDYLL